ncbi:MAG: PAS domain S-box protein [Gammaproteobacteria bacterium]|nr:PAS domain S-box protein [Gammaproteobacteria bacterium]
MSGTRVPPRFLAAVSSPRDSRMPADRLQWLAMALDAAPDATLIVDQEGRIAFASARVADTFGHAPETLVGQSVENLVPERLRAAHVGHRNGYFAENRSISIGHRSTLAGMRKDGSEFPVEIALHTLPGDDPRMVICTVRDVTEQVRTEERLRANEVRLRESEARLAEELRCTDLLHRLALESLTEWDFPGAMTAVVDAAIAITQADFGNMRLIEASSSSLSIVAQRNFPDWWIAHWRECGRGRGSCGTAYENRGRIVVEDVMTSPIFSGADLQAQIKVGVRAVQSTPIISRSGQALGVLSTHHRNPHRPSESELRSLEVLAKEAGDIIEQARYRTALTQSEERLRLAVDAAGVGLWDRDLATGRVYLSPKWKQQLGYRDDEMLDGFEAWQGRLHPDDRSAFLERIRTAADSFAPLKIEYRMRHKDGSYRWFYSVSDVIRDDAGKAVRLIGCHVDISERKQAEAALRRNEEQFKIFIEHAPVAVAVFDREMRYLAANARWRSDYRLTEPDLIGRSHFDVIPDLPERWRESYRLGLEGQLVRAERDAWDRADGSRCFIDWDIVPWRAYDGSIGGIILRTKDETARELADAQLRAARTEAESALKAKSRFLAVASHDLRQPLQTAAMLAAALQRVANGPEAREIIAQQREALASAAGLLNTLLDLSKLESGALQPAIEDFPLEEVLTALRRELTASALQKEIRWSIQQSDASARSDRTWLRQILQNLLTNALRYTPSGGRVELRVRETATDILIEVTDTGIGMTREQMSHIFEEFYQAPSTSEKRLGWGLGLSIVQHAAALLGHRIEVESEPGAGSVFRVVLARSREERGGPRDASIQSPAPSPMSSTHQAPARHRVLLIDDNESVLNATRLLLTIEGFEVDAVSTRAAVEELLGCEGFSPDAIISDYHLGSDDSGADLIQLVRFRLRRRIPAVLISGDTVIPPASRKLIDDVEILTKPVDADRLMKVLGRIMH